MIMSQNDTIPFRNNTKAAIADATLRAALQKATGTFTVKRSDAFAAHPVDEWREEASSIRMQVLDNLPDYVNRFEARASEAGATVHRAIDGQAAREIISRILQDHQITTVAKSKSMISEEIHLNDHLFRQGINAVETDLGEYIIQQADERPSHIIVPAIHKNRRQVGRLFADKLGCEYSEDPVVLTAIARKVLREVFLSAKAGLSGANFAVADSGSLVIFTNEGNGRMCTSLPPLHIAVLSIEKIVPSLGLLPKFIRLLPRSATGQVLTSYMSVITGTRKTGQATGARELHIVLLDNGRSGIVKGPYREMLKCIRCGACLNACPVYGTIGGHAYGTTYPGPMGIVLSNLIEGLDKAHSLLDGTTLCGACADVCPVKVPLPRLLRGLREERVKRGLTPKIEQVGMAAYGLAAGSSGLFNLGRSAARMAWPVFSKLVKDSPVDRMPRPAKRTSRERLT